jgi:hypothetical protein
MNNIYYSLANSTLMLAAGLAVQVDMSCVCHLQVHSLLTIILPCI